MANTGQPHSTGRKWLIALTLGGLVVAILGYLLLAQILGGVGSASNGGINSVGSDLVSGVASGSAYLALAPIAFSIFAWLILVGLADVISLCGLLIHREQHTLFNTWFIAIAGVGALAGAAASYFASGLIIQILQFSS